MSKCSAPTDGHGSHDAAARCAVHGRRAPDAIRTHDGLFVSFSVLDSFSRGMAASSPDADETTLLHILRNGSEDQVFKLARNAAITDLVAAELVRSKGDDLSVLRALVDNPSCPGDILVDLASEPSAEAVVVWSVARNPSTPPEFLDQLLRESGRDVQVEVADNPSAYTETLRGLWQGGLDHVQRNLAGNPSLPEDLLEGEALERYPREVVKNPSAPIGALRKLVNAALASGNRPILYAASHNANLPADCLLAVAEYEADSDSREILGPISKHPNRDARTTALLLTNLSVNYLDGPRLERWRDRYIRETFGVSEENERALNEIAQMDWSTLTPDAPEILLVKSIHRNA